VLFDQYVTRLLAEYDGPTRLLSMLVADAGNIAAAPTTTWRTTEESKASA
jgi:hypothetical protein